MQSGLSLYTTTDKRRDWILGLYEIAFGRQADASGYNYWRNTVLRTCDVQKARDTVWVFYLTSGDFQAATRGTTNATRKRQIRLLYWGALGRDANTAEQDYWNGVYTSKSWGDVVYSIIYSTEFVTRFWSGGSAYDGDIC